MSSFRALISCCLLVSALASASCQSGIAGKLLKAKAAPVSPFLDRRQEMRPARERAPFHYVWRNTDPAVQSRVMQSSEIYIAPVSLACLRPVSKNLARWEIEQGHYARDEARMAAELRARFAKAFQSAARPRFRLVPRPTARSITLSLAITELNPTSVKGNVVKTASKFVIGPFSAVLGVFTKGNIAIEGKVALSSDGAAVYQFSDNEKDKMTLYTLRDYRPYGHALKAMDEWARQFVELVSTPGDHRVSESSFFTLSPW
jgi:hypothetical protein